MSRAEIAEVVRAWDSCNPFQPPPLSVDQAIVQMVTCMEWKAEIVRTMGVKVLFGVSHLYREQASAVLLGLAIVEFCSTLQLEWDLIRRKRIFRLPMVLYFFTKYSAFCFAGLLCVAVFFSSIHDTLAECFDIECGQEIFQRLWKPCRSKLTRVSVDIC